MFSENITSAKQDMRGYVLKYFLHSISGSIVFVLFLLCSSSCFYILVVDTSFLSSIGIADNIYLKIALIAFSVAENVSLSALCLYIKLKNEMFFFDPDVKYDPNFKTVLKEFFVYSVSAVKKLLILILLMSPSVICLLILVSLASNGLSVPLFVIILVSGVILFVAGCYTYLVYREKFSLLSVLLIKNDGISISEIFRLSAEKMNGKCRKAVSLRFYTAPYRVICLLIFPAVYYLPLCKLIRMNFITESEKPYMLRKTYTAKPIVFYFKPIKER